jgi:predicted nuclease of predicted toxin-antitoxin system
MIHFLADENFNGKILRGVRRERPDSHIVRVQDTPLYQSSDPDILRWAAEHNRILLTHDIETMVGFALERVASGLPMPGVIAVRDALPLAQVIADLILIVDASDPGEWANLVIFLPL